MNTFLYLIILVCLWAALPLALSRTARHLGLPPATAALCLCAAGAAIAAVVVLPLMPLAPRSIDLLEGHAYQEAAFILAINQYVTAVAFSLLAVGGTVLVLQGLIHRRPALILLRAGHWLVHVAAGVLVLQSQLDISKPRRFIVYPELIYWWNFAGTTGATLLLMGLAAILLAPLTALLIRARQG